MRSIASFVLLLLACTRAAAQEPQPAACETTPAQLSANKKLVLDFFASTEPLPARAKRFLTQDYIQHNPRLLRLDEITGATGADAWSQGLKEAARRRIRIVDLGGIQFINPIILMAECDLVTAIYKGVLPDPDRPGRTYEAFAFETFRVRDGKLAEHWDQVKLSESWMQPAPHSE